MDEALLWCGPASLAVGCAALPFQVENFGPGHMRLRLFPFYSFLISPATNLGAFQGPKYKRHLLLTRIQRPLCGSGGQGQQGSRGQ